MKRSLQIISALLLTLPALAQQNKIQNHIRTKNPTISTQTFRQGPTQVNAAIIPIFSEDFASGFPASWSLIDNASSGEIWTYTTVGTGAGIALSPVNTSAANGYMMFDSDNGGPSSSNENCDITTPAINCTGQTQVYLSFNELYTEYQLDSAYVSVSNDGVNWTVIYCPDILLSQDESTANPNHLTFDISTVAANQPTVFVRFHYQGDWDYWWLIDDVNVFVPSAIEIAVLDMNPLSTEYTKLPLPQATSIHLSGIVKNLGGTTIAGGTALFEVIDTVSNAVVFTTTANISPLAPLQAFAIVGTAFFTPSSFGYYRTQLTVTATGDVDTLNNKRASFLVTHVNDSVLARDNNMNVGELGIGAGPAQGIIGQNFFTVGTNALTSVSIFLTDAMNPNPAGSPVWVTIHDQVNLTAPTGATATTDTIMITPGLIPPGGAWFTLPISGGAFSLAPGLHYFGAHEADSLLTLGLTQGIITPGSVWVSWTGIPTPPATNGWATADDFGFAITYQVRANFGSLTTVLDENTGASFEIYPNPSADLVNVSFAQNAERDIEVIDATGRAIQTTHHSNATVRLDLSAVAEGVYFIRVTENNKTSIQKISIVK